MGKVEIVAYITAKVEAVEGVKRVLPGRLKEGAYPPTGFPAVVVEVGNERLLSQTFFDSGSGKMQIGYDVTIVMLLDRKDASYAKAQAASLPFYDRMRAAFSNDPKLGGLCWDSTLSEALNNLNTFQEIDVSQYPQIAWKLNVIEERQYSAVAS